MLKDHGTLFREITEEAMRPKDYSKMTAEEIAALGNLLATLFIQSSITDGEGMPPLYRDSRFLDSIHRLAETICNRCESTSDSLQLALLCPTLFNLTRTGLFRYHEDRLRFDTKLVKSVLYPTVPPSGDYRPIHSALFLLMQFPLSSIEFDSNAHGNRRYKFTIGKELFEKTLRHWSETQSQIGSWPGIKPEEALSRINILESDFGSIKGIDNKKIADIAYNHYSKLPIKTATELSLLYRTSVCRWFNDTDDCETCRFADQAMAMLLAPSLTTADRLTLQSIILLSITNGH